MFERLRQWFSHSAEEIPEELSVCIFDCRKSECPIGDWEKCRHRLQGRLQSDEGRQLN